MRINHFDLLMMQNKLEPIPDKTLNSLLANLHGALIRLLSGRGKLSDFWELSDHNRTAHTAIVRMVTQNKTGGCELLMPLAASITRAETALIAAYAPDGKYRLTPEQRKHIRDGYDATAAVFRELPQYVIGQAYLEVRRVNLQKTQKPKKLNRKKGKRK